MGATKFMNKLSMVWLLVTKVSQKCNVPSVTLLLNWLIRFVDNKVHCFYMHSGHCGIPYYLQGVCKDNQEYIIIKVKIGGSISKNFMFCWLCISKYACNETNLRHSVSSVYWVTIPLHVLGFVFVLQSTEAYCTNPALVSLPWSPGALHIRRCERTLLARGETMVKKCPIKFSLQLRLPR
jgi:hypothetical protein